jgi:hypothetical protein
MNFFQGSWNVVEDEIPSHSPVRLLQKLAAYRASIASRSVTSSPQNEHKSSILTESTNFFTRLWRSSAQHSTPSPSILLASHETNSSSSFDHIPENCSASVNTSPVLSSTSSIINRRMSFIREVSSKSSSSYQTPSQSSSMSVPPHPSQPPLQAQQTTSSTVTDPSFEDTTSEQPFDTASELCSQSFETNIDSSNPGIIDDQDDEPNLTYDERQRRLSLTSKPMKTFVQPLSSLPIRITEQRHSDSLPSPEASIDVSMVSAKLFSIIIKRNYTQSYFPDLFLFDIRERIVKKK